MNTEQVLNAIKAERNYQDAKWGKDNPHSNEEWAIIANEEAGEVARAMIELWRIHSPKQGMPAKSSQLQLLQELVQYAAVITAWIENAASDSSEEVDFEKYAEIRNIQAAALINQRIGRSVVTPD